MLHIGVAFAGEQVSFRPGLWPAFDMLHCILTTADLYLLGADAYELFHTAPITLRGGDY